MENLVGIYLGIIGFNAVCLWIGMLIRGVDGTFFKAVIIATVTPFLVFLIPIPMARWMAIFVAQLIMLDFLTGAQIWPDGVIVVGISWVIGSLGGMLLLGTIWGGRVLHLVKADSLMAFLL